MINTQTLYQSRTLPAQDQLLLHYLIWPNRHSQQCTVLLHGFTNDAHIFDTAAQSLQSLMSVYCFDFRGHGDSAWDTEEKYHHNQLEQDLVLFLEQLPFQRIHLVGHSLGARVAMLLLGRHASLKQRIKSFTIIDTGPEVRAVGVNKVREDAENTPTAFPDSQSYYQYLSNIYLLAEKTELQRMAAYGLREIDGQLAPKTDPAFTRALWKPESNAGDSSDLKFPLNEELWQSLAAITCPTLVMKGQASAILGQRIAEKMVHDVMPNACLDTISRAGHALMVDNPEEFTDKLKAFIKTHI